MDSDKDLRKNGSGCRDETAYDAIKNVELERQKEYERFENLLNLIFKLCEIAGFHIEERIVIKDLRTGKIWR